MNRSILLHLLAALLAIAWAAPASAERVDVMIGYFPASEAPATRRVDLGRASYYLAPATMPVDRQALRAAKLVFIDQFPAGAEFFRDDMEAFHYMVHEGGLLVLVAGPDGGPETIANFNYLGTRFDFEVRQQPLAGTIAPVFPLQGPLGGNAWSLTRGALALDLRSPEWRVWFRHSDTAQPVLASRRIGQGLLVVVGTHDLEYQKENALTLIDWAMREAASATPERSAVPMPAPSGIAAAVSDDAARATAVANPPSDLLTERVAQLRGAYGVSAEPREPRTLLVARHQRQYLPFRPNISDVEGRMFSIPDYQGLAAVVIFWASWDPASRQMVQNAAEVIREVEGQGVAVIGVSLDRDPQAARQWMAERNLSFRLICDGTGWLTPLAEATGTDRLPRIMILDKTGRVAHGDLHPSDLAAAVAEAKGEV